MIDVVSGRSFRSAALGKRTTYAGASSVRSATITRMDIQPTKSRGKARASDLIVMDMLQRQADLLHLPQSLHEFGDV